MSEKLDKTERVWKTGREDSYRFTVSRKHLFRIKYLKTTFLKKVIKHGKIKKGSKILDVGCGGGTDSVPLALMGCEVTAIDVNENMIKNLMEYKNGVEVVIGNELKIDAIVGNLIDVKLNENYYDVVFSNGVLEHYLDDKMRKRVIEKMAKFVKPGGYIITGVPNGKHPFRQKFKKEGLAGYSKELPELDYSKELFEIDFNMDKLKIEVVDGIYLFMYVLSLPAFRGKLKYLILPFYIIIRLLERFFPKSFKRRFGFWLICSVKKLD